MKQYRSRITLNFLRMYRALPADVRERARRAYRRWREKPDLPGLRFKRVWADGRIYSVRIDARHRAVGELLGDEITWDFIGDHEAYARYLASL